MTLLAAQLEAEQREHDETVKGAFGGVIGGLDAVRLQEDEQFLGVHKERPREVFAPAGRGCRV